MAHKAAADDFCPAPFVTIRHDPPGWTVAIEPRLPNGEGEPRKFPCKSQAFHAASQLWTTHKIGLIDFTEGTTGRTFSE